MKLTPIFKRAPPNLSMDIHRNSEDQYSSYPWIFTEVPLGGGSADPLPLNASALTTCPNQPHSPLDHGLFWLDFVSAQGCAWNLVSTHSIDMRIYFKKKKWSKRRNFGVISIGVDLWVFQDNCVKVPKFNSKTFDRREKRKPSVAFPYQSTSVVPRGGFNKALLHLKNSDVIPTPMSYLPTHLLMNFLITNLSIYKQTDKDINYLVLLNLKNKKKVGHGRQFVYLKP